MVEIVNSTKSILVYSVSEWKCMGTKGQARRPTGDNSHQLAGCMGNSITRKT